VPRDECLPPLPTGAAPVDADAARRAVVAAVEAVFVGTKADESIESAFDDGSRVRALLQQVRSGPFGNHARYVQVDIRAVSFVAPDHAVARVDLTNVPPVTGDVELRLRADGWKLSFVSFCALVAKTGSATCP
jgi:hypothetical protein